MLHALEYRMPAYYADRRVEVFCGFYKKSSMITYVIFLRGKTHGRSCLFILSIYVLNIIPIMMIFSQSVDKPIIGLFLRYAS